MSARRPTSSGCLCRYGRTALSDHLKPSRTRPTYWSTSSSCFPICHEVLQDSQEGAPLVSNKLQAEQYNVPVERLDLSSRTLNCLKRAGINKVGEVLDRSKDELMSIRNFGEKSYNELYDKLGENDLLPSEDSSEQEEDEQEAVVTGD